MTAADFQPHEPAQLPRAGEAAILAQRYALALYELAAESNSVDVVAADIIRVQNLLRDSNEFRALIADPRVKTPQLSAAFATVISQAQLGDVVAQFLALTARNRRADLLPHIAAAFLAERALRAGEITAEVTVAQPLTAVQQQLLTTHLATATGGKVTLSVREDATLIGGFIVKLGSRLVDASLKGKLAALAQHLREAA